MLIITYIIGIDNPQLKGHRVMLRVDKSQMRVRLLPLVQLVLYDLLIGIAPKALKMSFLIVILIVHSFLLLVNYNFYYEAD